MTEKEKLEYLANSRMLINCLAQVGCPKEDIDKKCCAEYKDCVLCWSDWLLGNKKGEGLVYYDTDSMKTDLPEDMY